MSLPVLPDVKPGDIPGDIPGFPEAVIVHPMGTDPYPAGNVNIPFETIYHSPVFGIINGAAFNHNSTLIDLVGGTMIANHNGVTGLQFEYIGRKTDPAGSGEGDLVRFALAGDGEFVRGFKGTYNSRTITITSLTIITNHREHAVKSTTHEDDQKFEWFVGERQRIIGFSGTDNNYITSLSADYVNDDPPFDPGADVIVETAPNFNAMPTSLANAYKAGNYGQTAEAQKKSASDVNRVYEQIRSRGDQAWATIRAGDQDMRISYIVGVGTVYVWSKEVPDPIAQRSRKEGDPPATMQYAQIGSFSANGGTLQVASWSLRNLPPGVIALIAAVAIQKWFDSYFLARATRFISDAVTNLTGKLAGQGAIRAGGRAVVRAAGRVLTFGARWLIGPILGVLIGFAIDALWGYLIQEYILCANILNFDKKSQWVVRDSYGKNEEIYNGTFESVVIPPFVPDGSEVLPPGWNNPVENRTAIAYYSSIVYANAEPFFGGFAVAVSVQREDINDGFDFYYRVEKAASNSMGLGSPYRSAKDFFNTVQPSVTKSLAINSPVTIQMTSPELWNTSDDRYVCDVSIAPV